MNNHFGLKKPRKKSVMREQKIHMEILNHIKKVALEEVIVYHTPNGGKRGKVEAIKLKAMGTLAGIPDLTLLHNGQTYFIEIKADEKSRLSNVQVEMKQRLESSGFKVCVAWNKEMVNEFLIANGLKLDTMSV